MADFTFIDLFAGIGGIRLAFQRAGGSCLFSAEKDRFCRRTYAANFGEEPAGDINEIAPSEIPDHDILTAGFPCQPFSLAGVSKKNSLGREHGFRDRTQGTLFFKIAEILERKRPPLCFLENVKNLKSHDRGRTFRIIEETFAELDYALYHAVLDGRHYVPQHRERVYMVAVDRLHRDRFPRFSFPSLPASRPLLGEILEPIVDSRYVISDRLWEWFQAHARKHRARGNGFGFGLVGPASVARTLSARYYKDGSEILIERSGGNPRRLTPRECARLMGFPGDFQIPVSDTQAYRQFGNSVVVPLVESIARGLAGMLAGVTVENPAAGYAPEPLSLFPV